MGEFWLVAPAGGAGAVIRYTVDGVVKARVPSSYPLGTLTVNLTGSLLLGVLTGLTLAQAVSPQVQAVLGTGLLGGYTTFSTAGFETVRLAQERRWGAAALVGLGGVVGGTGLAFLGLVLGLRV